MKPYKNYMRFSGKKGQPHEYFTNIFYNQKNDTIEICCYKMNFDNAEDDCLSKVTLKEVTTQGSFIANCNYAKSIANKFIYQKNKIAEAQK